MLDVVRKIAEMMGSCFTEAYYPKVDGKKKNRIRVKRPLSGGIQEQMQVTKKSARSQMFTAPDRSSQQRSSNPREEEENSDFDFIAFNSRNKEGSALNIISSLGELRRSGRLKHRQKFNVCRG